MNPRVLLLATLIALSSTWPVVADTGGQAQAQRVLGYLMSFFDLDLKLADHVRATAPELMPAAARIDLDELAARLSLPLSRSLAPDEASACLAFVDSPHARVALDATEGRTSQQALAAIRELPTESQAAIEGFFRLPCAQKSIEFLASPEAKRISQAYGKEVGCGHLARTEPEVHARARERGECPLDP